MSDKMTISQFARAGGVGIETVRFYQRRGLLPVPQAVNEYRHYDGTYLQRLRFIRRAQLGGFTLKEIKELLQYDPLEHRQQIQGIARTRLEQLTNHIRQLENIREALSQLVEQCEKQDSQVVCPIIQALGGGNPDDFGSCSLKG